MNSLKKLPEDIQRTIFDFSFFCKKDQNFYIDKELTKFILKKNEKCKAIKCLGKNICKECHKDTLKFLNLIAYTFI